MTALATVLEKELRDRYRSGKNLLVWLDSDDLYTPFVDQLAQRDDFPAKVVAFRGSFLETLLALEPLGSGLDPERLLVHLPGHNDKTVRATPLLELYHAGTRFEKAWTTLVREAAAGSVAPEEIERFLASEPAELERAERWLESCAAQSASGLDAWLEELEDGWILEGIFDPHPHSHEGRKLRPKIEAEPDGLAALRRCLNRRTGLSDAFLAFYHPEPLTGLDTLADTFAAWLMSVEYIDDLRCPPRLDTLKPLATLSAPLLERCRHLVRQLREHLPERYTELAAVVEERLKDELDHVAARDLGAIDTFKKEADRMLEAAIAALRAGHWAEPLDWAGPRTEGSFWLRRDLGRRSAWALAKAAAVLGRALTQNPQPLASAASLDDALERYRLLTFEVDGAHRRFEQQRLNSLGQTLPHFAALRATTDDLRRRYRTWADALADAFAALCEQHGFLPSPEHQQRNLYDQLVHPLLASGGEPVVLFLVDALRFEMAAELAEALRTHGAEVRLEARLAELPTLTAVGMNALAPVARGGRLSPRLDPQGRRLDGFLTGELSVSEPEDRLRAMHQRSLGAGARSLRLDLATVLATPPRQLEREIGRVQLLLVHSREIDEAGESEVGLATFEALVRQLANAWHRLTQAGFRSFVFAADHGFLLHDPTTADPQRYGATRHVPQRRFVLAEQPAEVSGCVRVALAALGYTDPAGTRLGGSLLFRRDTKVFATSKPVSSFTHGGNSLQERVVPVLIATYRPSRKLSLERYRIAAAGAVDRRAGVYRLPIAVRAEQDAQSVLEIARERELPIALGVPGRDDVAVVIHDVEGGKHRHGHWQLVVGTPAVVCFDLRGARDERVQVEVSHPERDDRVQPWVPETFFEVAGQHPPAAAAPLAAPVAASSPLPEWAAALGDEGTARVFAHLERHGAITESELVTMLGSARAARRFALVFDELLERIPFTARIEIVGGVKRYVRAS